MPIEPNSSKRSFLQSFSMYELIIIALMATLGVATKPFIVPLAHIITGPLFIPGGTVAGGFYMLWIVLGAALVKRKGAGTLICTVQAILVIALGIYGTHGIISFLTYLIPGIAIDIVFFLSQAPHSALVFFLAGCFANISGSYLVNLVFFRLPWIPLLLSLSASALSGGLGGLIAYALQHKVQKVIN